jgi:hypothetical protein
LRRRSQVKRGALYTANPLLPDTTGSVCRRPGLPVSAPRGSGGCKKGFRPLQAIDGDGLGTGPRWELETDCGVHCASFLLCTCTTGMARMTPCMEWGNKRDRALESLQEDCCAEGFSYSVGVMTISQGQSVKFVRFSLRRVTLVFQSGHNGVAADAFASRLAPTLVRALKYTGLPVGASLLAKAPSKTTPS